MPNIFKIPVYSEATGKTRTVKVEADNKPEALSMVRPKTGETILNQRIKKSGGVIRRKLDKDNLSDFAFDLASLIEGNMSPKDAMAVIADTTENSIVRGVAQRITRKLQTGKGISESFEDEKDIIGETAVGLIKQGEISRDLEGSLKTLAEILHREVEQKSKVTSAIFAPCITLMILSGVINMAMLILIPKVKHEIGSRFEVNIISKALFWVSDIWGNVWWIFLLLFIAGAIAIWRSSKLREKAYMFIMRNWALARSAFLANKFADFAYIFGRMMERKLPQTEALRSSALRFGSSQFARQLIISAEQVKQGRPLYDVLTKETNLDLKTLAQIKIGVETGRLDNQLVNYGLNAYERSNRALERFERVTSMLALFIGGFMIIVSLGAAYAPIIEYTMFLMKTA